MLLDRIFPEPSAAWWQAIWIALVVLLPYLLIWPHAKDLWRYSGEGANKGGLALLRGAAESYKAAAGEYPPDIAALQRKGFIREVPRLWDSRFAGFEHAATSAAVVYAAPEPRDSGAWAFVPVKGAAPRIFIDCTHKDSRGTPWSAY
jgi:hypothetical protein